MGFLFLIFPFLLIAASVVVFFRELSINYYNPLPKFENGDKRINDIDFIKTRCVVKFSQKDDAE